MKLLHDNLYRIAGVVGLMVLLTLALWTQYKRQPPEHDHSDPAQHGNATGAKPLKDSQRFIPSGTLKGNVRVVNYDAFQYHFSPDPLVVYSGETVELKVKSNDTQHGVMIPDIDFSTEIPLGQRKSASFKAPDKPGVYPLFCSVFCGPGHGDMTGKLIVLPLPEKEPEAQDTGDDHHDHTH